MHRVKRVNCGSQWFVDELSARIVAASGRPDDRFHFGKLILQSLKDTPDFVLQVDGATGKKETSGSVLERTVRCANAFRALGLQCGDVIVLMAPNHLDLAIPYYAALYLGVIVASIDRLLQIRELQDMFVIDEPKLIFCQSERAKDVSIALDNTKQFDAKIVIFDESTEIVKNSINFYELLEKFGDGPDVNSFKPSDLNPEEAIALLVTTSGTTGLPKQAAISYKNCILALVCLWCTEINFPTPTSIALILSPLQWLSAIMIFHCSPILKITRLQSSLPMDQNHGQYVIETYKPTYMIVSPTLLATLIKPKQGKKPDFTSLETVIIGGSYVSPTLLEEMRMISPKTEFSCVHGMTEASGLTFVYKPDPIGTVGATAPQFLHRLINVETQEDIIEPNTPGELWIKGPLLFKGYYKNEKATKETFTEDGWFKTGDVFYTDEHGNFFFVERIKLLLKYMNHQISPLEIQNVIRQHPGVMDVAVTGIPHPECGELPVACVVRRPGHDIQAQEIKDLVRDNLTDSKQLRGGVIFLNSLPVTPTTKIDYRKLKEMALKLDKE